MMDKKLIITKVPSYSEFTFCALYDDNKLVRLEPIRENDSKLSNIYVGRVDSIAKNLDAAFIDIGEKQLYFLNLEDAKNIIFTSKNSGKIKVGDEFLVQVDKEATKQKNPIVKTELALTGRYAVCFSKKGAIHFSSKLTKHQKTRIGNAMADCEFPYELTIRTNAGVDEDYPAIINEINALCEKMDALISRASFLKAKTCVYEAPKGITRFINQLYDNQFDEIITDISDIYENSISLGLDNGKLRFYTDDLLPLYKLFRLESGISEALSRRIYLKSGAFLVWDETEALTAIDVNSGGFTKGCDKQGTFYKINEEAAKEIARQIQLRNTSGIIIVDLINMGDFKNRERILECFKNEMSQIYNRPHVVDITKLGLLEMTRKKQEKTLKELLFIH